ncbi:MAG: CoA-binding protein [Dehalococcoidia bacterium]
MLTDDIIRPDQEIQAPPFGEGFPPKTIALVGVSRTDHLQHPGYTGLRLLRILRDGGYEGRIYPVNPKADYIDGIKAYPEVSAIPERVDLVNITVPSPKVPAVLDDCARAGARNVQICSSGFGETGQPEGKDLDRQIIEIARRTGLRVIGPNCMGFHVPSARMKMFEDVPLEAGPVAFLSQSGGHARVFIHHASAMGIGVSKVISHGNALLMDTPNFLEALESDPDTGIICMYLEGVRDGQRLMDMVRRINKTKPVIIWKGGLTGPGARAAASHTASLAGEKRIWEAFFKQTGAIQAGSIADLIDMAVTLDRLGPAGSKRVAVLGAGGGDTVAAGDACANAGLELPLLSPLTREQLMEFIFLVNQGIANPLDLPIVFRDVDVLRRTLRVLASDPAVDALLIRVGSEFFTIDDIFPPVADFAECILDLVRNETNGKPIMVAVTEESSLEPAEKHARALREFGVPALGSLQRASHALSRAITFQQYQREH